MLQRAALVLVLVLGAARAARSAPGDQVFTVVPTMPVSNQDFGDAVAIDGNYVLVGAEDTPDGSTPTAGAAYLFDGATGAYIRRFTPTDPPATRAFGTSVAIDGQLAAMGAEDENNDKGAAYLFNVNGTQVHKFVASDGASGDEFGQDVGVSGNVAVVSSPGAGGVGAIYLYNATTGTQIGGTTRPSGLVTGAEFGSVVDIDGDRIIASFENAGLGGAAYVYDTTGALLRTLTLPTEPPYSTIRGFGRSVAISGNIALVGATPSSDQVFNDVGTAFLIDVSTGSILHQLFPSTSAPNDLFGESVAISGNVAMVASRREDTLGLVNTAFLFDVTTGVQIAQLDGTGIPAGDEAFEGIDIDGGRAVTGQESFDSPGFNNNGRAIVFDALVGDYNDDNRVDGGDFLAWQRGVGVGAGRPADGDRDGDVDGTDLSLWRGNYGVAAPASGAMISIVPEPSAVVLVILSLAAGGVPLTRRSFRRA